MLYRHPGPHEIHGNKFDTLIVDADEVGAIKKAQSEGWYLTTPEALKAGANPAKNARKAADLEL